MKRGFRAWAHTHSRAMEKFELTEEFVTSAVQREPSGGGVFQQQGE